MSLRIFRPVSMEAREQALRELAKFRDISYEEMKSSWEKITQEAVVCMIKGAAQEDKEGGRLMTEEEILEKVNRIIAPYELWAEIVSLDGKKCGINLIGSHLPNEAIRETIKSEIDEALKPLEARIAFVNDRDF